MAEVISIRCDGAEPCSESCQQGMEGCSMEPYRSWKRRKCSGTLYSQPRQRKRHHRQNELTDFVEALKTPRVILLMVQAGPAVDELTGKLFPLMEKGDILIDGVPSSAFAAILFSIG